MDYKRVVNLGNRIVNTYIYPIAQGYVLIDTGYESGYKTLCQKLKKHNISLNDISYVFLTHAHDDHAGFLNQILDNTQAKVIMSKKAVNGLLRGQNSFHGGCSSLLAWIFCKAMALVGKGSHRYPPLEERFLDRCILIDDNTKPELEQLLLGKIIETPGHTSCSISLYAHNGILFCGDAAMNGLPSQKRITIWIEDVEEFKRSWEAVINLRPKLIYSGHGKPFSTNDLIKNVSYLNEIKLRPLKSTK